MRECRLRVMRLARYCGIAPAAAILAGCATGVQQEISLGQRTAAPLERQQPLIHDPDRREPPPQ